MIGQLTGQLVSKAAPDLVLSVAGVGYELQAPMTTFYQLPALNDTVCLFTHLVVREDAQLLYGFIDQISRDTFRQLIKINGVGPKLALAILSGLTVNELLSCVEAADLQRLVKIPGVGKKTAERLLIELRDKLSQVGQINTVVLQAAHSSTATATASAAVMARPFEEALSALVALGYKPFEAKKTLQKLPADSEADCEQLIRAALQQMAR